jgi:hypothetical protein
MLAHQLGEPQIMVMVDQIVPEIAVMTVNPLVA